MDPVSAISKVLGIDKLIDYGASGVGAIAGPLLAPVKARQEAKAKLIAAEADAQIREIEARGGASALNIIAEAQAKAREYLLPGDADIRAKLDITPQDIAQSIEFQGRKRIANARAVLEAAADELGDKEVDDHEPDPDWNARYFGYVQDVSSGDLQKVWAKILAGEVESPGRTSLRTLDTLRNMTQRDAEMFRDICDFVIGGDFVFYEGPVKKWEPLGYSKLFHLQDCGLINAAPSLVKEYQWGNSSETILAYQDGALLISKDSQTTDRLVVPDVLLTAAGKELFSLVQCTFRMEYLQAFSRFLKSKDCRLDYLESAQELAGGELSYARRILIEPEPEQAEGATL